MVYPTLNNEQTIFVLKRALPLAVYADRTIRTAHIQLEMKENQTENNHPCCGRDFKVNCYGPVFLDKLTVPHLVKKSLIFYGGRRFITVFTTARNLYLT